jgi:two-component system response regulator DesR
MIRVLIAEDQGMVRGALASLLSLEPDVEVVAQVARGDEVLEAAIACSPDIALLDIEMPGQTGLDAAEQLAASLPDCRVLILTTFGRPGYLRRAMEGGASGFLLKDAPASELANAIRRALTGERIVDPGLAAAALSQGECPLTPRGHEVLAASREHATVAELAPASGCGTIDCRARLAPCSVRRARSRTASVRGTGSGRPRSPPPTAPSRRTGGRAKSPPVPAHASPRARWPARRAPGADHPAAHRCSPAGTPAARGTPSVADR